MGKTRKRERNRGIVKAAVRQKREGRKGRNRELSSRKWNGSGRKEAEGKRKIRKAQAGSKHLRNSCGSESGKGERKHTAKLSTGTGKECTGNQAGENGESQEAKAEGRTEEATVRRRQEERERKNRGLSSQNRN